MTIIIRCNIEVGDDFAEEDLGAEARIDKHTVFADEAEACLESDGPFEKRSGIDANSEFEALAGKFDNKIDEEAQLFFYEGMVVLVLGV